MACFEIFYFVSFIHSTNIKHLLCTRHCVIQQWAKQHMVPASVPLMGLLGKWLTGVFLNLNSSYYPLWLRWIHRWLIQHPFLMHCSLFFSLLKFQGALAIPMATPWTLSPQIALHLKWVSSHSLSSYQVSQTFNSKHTLPWTYLFFNLSVPSWFHFLLNLTCLDFYHIHYFNQHIILSPVPWIATI